VRITVAFAEGVFLLYLYFLTFILTNLIIECAGAYEKWTITGKIFL